MQSTENPTTGDVAPKKSECGGECSRKVCTTAPALWWNTSTRQFYCKACAMMINRENKQTLCFQSSSRLLREMSIRFAAIAKVVSVEGLPGMKSAMTDYNMLATGPNAAPAWPAVGFDRVKMGVEGVNDAAKRWRAGLDTAPGAMMDAMTELARVFAKQAEQLAKSCSKSKRGKPMETETPKRPKERSPEILQAAAKRLEPMVSKWLSGETPPQTIIDDLVRALSWSNRFDGYKLAQKLDRYGYTPDAELVEILDAASHYLDDAKTEAFQKWVKENNLTGPASETKVRCKNNQLIKGIGVVTRNDAAGRSVVMFPEMGHVREGLGTHGIYLNWEDLEVVNEG